MKYLLPLAIALVFTACNNNKKAETNETNVSVEQNMTETNATETNATEANATDANKTK